MKKYHKCTKKDTNFKGSLGKSLKKDTTKSQLSLKVMNSLRP